jgi:predicted P-loop ATPase
MADFVMNLPEIKILAAKERMSKAVEEFDDGEDAWLSQLAYDKSGVLVNSLHNIRLIMENDPELKGIVFNELADGMEIKGEVPWKHPARFWRDADDAQLISYIDDRYGTFSQRNYQIGVTKVSDDRSYHPIREYFDSLPEWDGEVRAESIFIDYLGAQDNDYVKAATRKTLCAAYKRVLEPGIKFDFCPVLNGPQGIGKSTVIAKLGMQWYSDSLSLSDMNDKTAAEKLQGFWILEIGELAGMKKADIDKVKAFISRQDDKYRASFGRRVTPHPRQCIFIGTTNSENGYLRDITGNRRFWNIKVTGVSTRHSWEITQDLVDQIWAEVKVISEKEDLFLPPELETYAKQEQNSAMELDEREGLVAEYLDTLLPENWDSMDAFDRRNYIRDKDDPTTPEGTVLRETVSNMEIWCECFGRQKEELRPSDSYAITALMMRMSQWERTNERPRLKIYGQQRIYRRKHGKI